jgi:hypothetical protein
MYYRQMSDFSIGGCLMGQKMSRFDPAHRFLPILFDYAEKVPVVQYRR